MKTRIGAVYRLTDRQGHDYGDITLTEISATWFIGELALGHDFGLVADAFGYLEEVANAQMLSLIDDAMAPLEGVGFIVRSMSDGAAEDAFDVQVMNGHDIVFKLKNREL